MMGLLGWLVIRLPISEWFSDEELISQLQMFFDVTENIDFQALLGQIQVVDEDTRHIDFVVTEEDRPRSAGKSDKSKAPGRRKQKTMARIRKKGKRRH